MGLKGKKVVILKGINKGADGYVRYEDAIGVAIEAPDLIGVKGAWYGFWYEQKANVKEV